MSFEFSAFQESLIQALLLVKRAPKGLTCEELQTSMGGDIQASSLLDELQRRHLVTRWFTPSGQMRFSYGVV